MKPVIIQQLEAEGFRTETIRFSLANLLSQPIQKVREFYPDIDQPIVLNENDLENGVKAVKLLAKHLIDIDNRKDETAFNELLDFALNQTKS